MKISIKNIVAYSVLLLMSCVISVVHAGTLTIDFESRGADFGSVLARGDFNGDGKISLVVGSPGDLVNGSTPHHYNYIENAGFITVISEHTYFSNIEIRKVFSQFGAIEGHPEVGDKFGSSLAVGDFNGDSYDDLAIGIPGESLDNRHGDSIKGVGAVSIIYGSPSGLSSDKNEFWSGIRSYTAGYGSSLASGNFDNDSYDDLAIGVPGYGGGRVEILHGTQSGLSTKNRYNTWRQGALGVVGAEEGEDRFGSSLVSGDFNGDEYDDLAIGAPGESIGAIKEAGAVNILYGSPQSITANNNQIWYQDISGILGASESGDAFGHSLATGNFDGDQYDDLVIGVPGEDIGSIVGAGAVNVLRGNIAGLTSQDSQFWSQNSDQVLGSSELGDQFGENLAAGDFNGDGFDEIAIGVIGEVVTPEKNCFLLPCFKPSRYNEGAVNILYGSINGINANNNQFWSQESPDIEGKSELLDFFGAALIAGDFNNDGHIDLSIGVPFENDKGAVNTIFSTTNGLSSYRNRIIME